MRAAKRRPATFCSSGASSRVATSSGIFATFSAVSQTRQYSYHPEHDSSFLQGGPRLNVGHHRKLPFLSHARPYVTASTVTRSFDTKGHLTNKQRKKIKERGTDDEGENEDEEQQKKQEDKEEKRKEREKAFKIRRDLDAMMEQLKPGCFWTQEHPPKVMVIHPHVKFQKGIAPAQRDIPSLRLYEAIALAESMAWPVVDAKTVSFSGKRNPRLFFGSGKFEELKQQIADKKPDILYVDTEQLTPSQMRNMSLELGVKVLDRFRLILEIFSQRAETNESKLQVELASLPYRRAHLPVLIESASMAQQRGGGAFMTGAGETILEVEKRTLSDQEKKIKKELEQIAKTREVHRNARKEQNVPTFAIVGYTNAGKSALLNTLSGAQLDSHNMLFASLHTHVRKVELPSGNMALGTDTVGFISDLPHRLVAPFRSTLEAISAADVVLHVRDITNVETERQKRNVHQVLNEVYKQYGKRTEGSEIELWNKVDLLDKQQRKMLRKANKEGAYLISAKKGKGIEKLLQKLDELFLAKYPNLRQVFTVVLPDTDHLDPLQYLHAHGRVKTVKYLTKAQLDDEQDEKEEDEQDTEKKALLTAPASEETDQQEEETGNKEEEEEAEEEKFTKVTVQMTRHDYDQFMARFGKQLPPQ